MSRQLRIEYPGAIYHVMSRGNQRERIFRDETDRRLFLAALEAAVGKTQWQVHAYCLMSNHFHLVVETPQANLVAGMKWLLGVYTKRFNIRHQLCGHLFAGRYQALVVDGSGNGYLKTVCDYVHLNPVRAKLLSLRAPLRSFGWSTYRFYLLPPGQRPEWLRVDRLLGEWGIPKDSAAGRAEFERRMEQRRAEDLGAEFKPVERGWCLGGETFRAELLEAVAARMGPSHYGTGQPEAVAARAERLVREGLVALGWTDGDLARRRKGDPGKVRLARQLRAETTMTLHWIANRLQMGRWTYVSNLLRETIEPVACVNSED
jgi:REP element-mobilizing transposase RayT